MGKHDKFDSHRCFQNNFLDQHFKFGCRKLPLDMLDGKTLYSTQIKKNFKAPTFQSRLDNHFKEELEWPNVYLLTRKVFIIKSSKTLFSLINNCLNPENLPQINAIIVYHLLKTFNTYLVMALLLKFSGPKFKTF